MKTNQLCKSCKHFERVSPLITWGYCLKSAKEVTPELIKDGNHIVINGFAYPQVLPRETCKEWEK